MSIDWRKTGTTVRDRVLLALNDVDFDAGNEAKYIATMSLAEGWLKEKAFAAWLRRYAELNLGKRVQDSRARRYRVRK